MIARAPGFIFHCELGAIAPTTTTTVDGRWNHTNAVSDGMSSHAVERRDRLRLSINERCGRKFTLDLAKPVGH